MLAQSTDFKIDQFIITTNEFIGLINSTRDGISEDLSVLIDEERPPQNPVYLCVYWNPPIDTSCIDNNQQSNQQLIEIWKFDPITKHDDSENYITLDLLKRILLSYSNLMPSAHLIPTTAASTSGDISKPLPFLKFRNTSMGLDIWEECKKEGLWNLHVFKSSTKVGISVYYMPDEWLKWGLGKYASKLSSSDIKSFTIVVLNNRKAMLKNMPNAPGSPSSENGTTSTTSKTIDRDEYDLSVEYESDLRPRKEFLSNNTLKKMVKATKATGSAIKATGKVCKILAVNTYMNAINPQETFGWKKELELEDMSDSKEDMISPLHVVNGHLSLNTSTSGDNEDNDNEKNNVNYIWS